MKTPEELVEYNLGYKEGEIVGTNYVQMIRASNYTNDVVLAEEIAAKVFERKADSQSYLRGFRDALNAIAELFETETKKLKKLM